MERFKEKIAGVYVIWCESDPRYYIGSSVNVMHRKWCHFNTLKKQAHFNRFVQKFSNDVTIEHLRFSLLEVTSPQDTFLKEHSYLKKYFDDVNCLNMQLTPGKKNELTRQILSKISRLYQASLSPEQRSNNAKKGWSKLTVEERSEISRAAANSLTAEQRSVFSKAGSAAQTPEMKLAKGRKAKETLFSRTTAEQRSETARKREANKTPEQKAASRKKAVETRFRNQEKKREQK